MDITGLGGLFDFGTKVLERIFPDPKDRLEAQTKLLELQQTGELAKLAADTDLAKGQLEINKIEAGSENLFVSGWRPAIGWCCAAALFYHSMLQPLVAFILANMGRTVVLPAFDMVTLSSLLFGLLGLGGTMRTIEKIKGVV